MKWALIVITVFVSSCGDILCAKGMSAGKELEVRGAKSVVIDFEYIVTRRLVLLGWACYAAAFFSLIALLSVAKMTVAVPATAFSFVIDTIGARFILREHVPWRRWIGVMCVTAGVILAIKPASNTPSLRQFRGADTVKTVPRAADYREKYGVLPVRDLPARDCSRPALSDGDSTDPASSGPDSPAPYSELVNVRAGSEIALARPAAGHCSAMQSGQDQPGGDHRRAQQLDPESAARKVFAKP